MTNSSANRPIVAGSEGCARMSDRHAGRVIIENPVVARLYGFLVPLRIDIGFCTGRVCERRIVEALRHLVRAAHKPGGTLDTCGIVFGECHLDVVISPD